MKNHSIVFFILFAIVVGCRQCSANLALTGLDPLSSLLRPDPNSLLLSRPSVELSPFIAQPESIMDVALRSLDQQLMLPGDLSSIVSGQPTVVHKLAESTKRAAENIINIVKKVLSIPISVIRFALLPITITYNIVKFFFKLFFLPLTIGWRIAKVVLYPIKLILQKILSPDPQPFVMGLPTPHVYTSTLL